MITIPNRQEILDEVLRTLREIRDDLDYDREITEQTGFFRDLGFESIDVVALGAALEEHFDQPLPFAEFLTRASEQKLDDLTVGSLVSFLAEHLATVETGQP
jgi:acyl carrier protein